MTNRTAILTCPVCGDKRARLIVVTPADGPAPAALPAKTYLKFACRKGCEPDPETLDVVRAALVE